MNTEQARSLVQETFQQKFDKRRFRTFGINLLNHVDESRARKWERHSIKDAFNNHVKTYERLGIYTSPEKDKLDVLTVYLTTTTKLKLARTAIRNFVADHLKTHGNNEAALVAFVSPNEKQWRFSHIRMEHVAVKTGDGKVDMKTRLTSARRSSYLVGEGESCHTAQSQFLDLLKDTENRPALAQIEDAFSVEAVTKEFFDHYKTLFLGLKDELDSLVKKDKNISVEFAAKHISTADFAKKLLGQIVFLYFLQKKGWLGVPKDGAWGSGPCGFLRQLLDGRFRSYKNLFNDILEPLFYNTLATDRGHEAWCKTFNCRIPFLNGGLFEPPGNYDWRNTDINIPNERFSNPDRTKVGDIGTGILDVFDRYNFTVNEAEPLETEVAIDPEMLGKVFEKLLDVKERKSKGSFYTPREIVHYMCQESLINHLNTALNSDRMTVPRDEIEIFIHSGDQAASYEAARLEGTSYQRKLPKNIEIHARDLDEKLAALTVCDPAIGSGAFPVGMMQEIVRARTTLTPYFNDVRDRTSYEFKRHAIQHCLYGVDIDPSAVEIAKLRLWLSLVVDENNVTLIKPLPNLDYKVVTGNSLLGVKKNLLNIDLFQRLEELKPRYFDATDRNQKEKLKREIDDLIHSLTNEQEDFDFEIYFSEVMDVKRRGGFDVVIGNPPYVRQEAIKKLKSAIKACGYECFHGGADLLVYFYERGVTLLRRDGTIAMITSNKFYRSGYGEKLRRFLIRELTLDQLIDFGDAPVFDALAYASIVVGVRSAQNKNASALTYNWERGIACNSIAQVVRERGQQVRQIELKPEGWRLESPAVFRLFEKIRLAGKPLGEYVDRRFYYGIKTGLNEAFVVDQATRDRLIREHKSSAEILKPFLRGRDVNRWHTKWSEHYLVKIESSANREHPWSARSEREAERVFAATYPAVHEHFRNFRAALKKRTDQGSYFWELRSCIYWQEFEQPKIILGRFMNKATFAFDQDGFYHNDAVYLITGADTFVVAILNSSVSWWFLRQTCTDLQNEYLQAYREKLFEIPIPVVATERQEPVKSLAGRILLAKQRDAKADVTALERELDELVCTLYGLTAAEKSIVETETAK